MKRKHILKSFSYIAILTATAIETQAATLVDFTLEEQASGFNSGPFTATSSLADNISAFAEGRGEFNVGGGGSQAGEINWSRWDKGIRSFLTVVVDVDPLFSVQLDTIQLRISRNGGGAPDSLFATVLSGSDSTRTELASAPVIDDSPDPGFVISGGAGGSTSVGLTTWDLSGVDLQTGAFQIALGYSGGADGNLRISDIIVNGIVSPIPESSAYGFIIGVTALAGVTFRRRRR